MIHFSAFANLDPAIPVPADRVQAWRAENKFPQLTRKWDLHRGNVFLSMQGDVDLDRFVHISPRLVLICHADLLGSQDGGDFSEANLHPAACLARLYEKLGDGFVCGLHGSFGIALYDQEQRALKAWTDHFGVRRLVYRSAQDALSLASDLRILNKFDSRSPEIDPVAVLEYMQFSCIPAPRTIYKGVFRLEPGHWLTSRPAVQTRAYWDMRYRSVARRSQSVWAAETYAEIRSAVARAAKTAEPAQKLGCFLSGGTDSSSVSGLTGSVTSQPARTYSIGFDDPRYNEIEYARTAARHFRTDHHEYFVTPQDILDLLEKANGIYDEPFGNSSIIPAYYCARLAAAGGTTHMLAGDGGDELFGGNQRYANDRVFQRYGRVPALVRGKLLEPLLDFSARRTKIRLLDLAARYTRRAGIPLPERIFSYDFLSSVPRDDVFHAAFLASLNGADPLAAAKSHFSHAPAQDDLDRWLYLDLKITITDNDVRKVTPMSELAGIVTRYPLLDHRLAEFSGTVPPELKVKGVQLRYIFKEAMRGFLPRDIIQKKKHGFGLPFSVWMSENEKLRALVHDTLGSSACRRRGYFREDMIEKLWAAYDSESRIYYGDVIWPFLMLELWHLSADREVRL